MTIQEGEFTRLKQEDVWKERKGNRARTEGRSRAAFFRPLIEQPLDCYTVAIFNSPLRWWTGPLDSFPLVRCTWRANSVLSAASSESSIVPLSRFHRYFRWNRWLVSIIRHRAETGAMSLYLLFVQVCDGLRIIAKENEHLRMM